MAEPLNQNDLESADKKLYTYKVATEQIKSMIYKNETFTNVKAFFQADNDERTLLMLYTHLFEASLPQKCRDFIYQLFDIFDEKTMIQWIGVVYLPKEDATLFTLLEDCDICKCLDDLKRYNSNVANFLPLIYKNMRKSFCKIYIESTQLDGIFGIYRLLKYCEIYTKRSSVYCNAVKKLEKKLQYVDVALHLETDATANSAFEHTQLMELVDNYQPLPNIDQLKELVDKNQPLPNIDLFRDLIKKMFEKSVTTVHISATTPHKLEVQGHKIFASNVYDEIKEKIEKNGNITEIEIWVKDDLILDTDLTFKGKSLILAANNRIVVPNPVICDLSGKDAPKLNTEPAADGISPGGDGKNGKDGIAGESSGNMVICTKLIEGEEKLTVVLNGGNGSNGQNGGNGANGEDGVGVKFENVFGIGHSARKITKQVVNKITFAVYSRMIDNNIKKTVLPEGVIHEQSDSANYSSTHTYEFFYGANGKPGGKGGKNGCSGEGGKKGKLDVLPNEEHNNNKMKVQATDGKDGYPGIPGKYGENGKDGWDVAMLWISFKTVLEYGKNHNVKLSLTYTDVQSDESVYVREKDNGPGSKCYAQITEKPCTRKFLQEKRTEFKSDSERSGEAIAVKATAINLEEVIQKQQSFGHLLKTDATDQEQQIDSEAVGENEIGRIIELWEPFVDLEYIPKTRVELKMLSSEFIEKLSVNEDNLDTLWTAVTEESLKHLIKAANCDLTKIKLQRKELIGKLRNSKKELKNTSVDQLKTKPEEVTTILETDFVAYCKLYNTLKKLVINQDIRVYMDEIESAFVKPKKLGEIITDVAEKLSIETLLIEQMNNQVFKTFQQEYENLPDSIKTDATKALFYFVKLQEYIFCYHDLASDKNPDVPNLRRFLLEKTRIKYTRKFTKKLKNIQGKLKYTENDFLNGKESLSKLEKLFAYFPLKQESENYVFKELNFLCKIFPGISSVFLNTLQFIFDSEGCHIDLFTFKYLVDTLFSTCKYNGAYNVNIIPAILLPSKQDAWIDECFIFNTETAMKSTLKNKKPLLKELNNIVDENLKILLSKKMLTEEIHLTEDELFQIVANMKDATTLFPHLKNLPLSQWLKLMNEINFSNNIKNQQLLALPKESKTLILFWASKLLETFKNLQPKVNDIIDQLIKLIPYDRNVISRFMQRLWSNDIAYDLNNQSIEDILRAALNLMSSSAYDNNKSIAFEIAMELLDYKKQKDNNGKDQKREVPELKALFNNLNDSAAVEIFNEFIDMISKPYSNDVEDCINKCLEMLGTKKFCDYQTSFKKEHEEMCKDEIDYDVFLLKIIDTVIYKKREFNLHYTQQVAVLSALRSDKEHKGMLQQISTGEGKTLIIAVVSIISAFKSLKVNIITSSSVLAKRDVSRAASGCLEIYESFGLTADHICYDSVKCRQNAYSTCDIIYGDLASYQRDYLMDEFYSKDIATSRKFHIVIIDEVDSLLLDNGLNTLYLSHEIAEFEMLQSLLINIWDMVNIRLKSENDCDNLEFYQNVYKSFFPTVILTDLGKILEVTDNEANEFQTLLINNHIIDDRGTIFITKKDALLRKFETIETKLQNTKNMLSKKLLKTDVPQNNGIVSSGIISMAKLFAPQLFDLKDFKSMLMRHGIINEMSNLIIDDLDCFNKKMEEIEQSFESKRIFFIREYDKIIKNNVNVVPDQLQSYVKFHLKDFITNAENAYHMEVGISYQVDIIPASRSNTLKPKIVIIDRDSGVDLPTTQWHKGLHQFLQLKHGLALTPLSTKAVFISNVTFIKKFQRIYGFSGTLGAKTEKDQLKEIYDLPSIILPSSHAKLFFEEYSIVTKTIEAQYEEIFNITRLKLDEGRSVLIVTESLNQVLAVQKNVVCVAKNKLSDDDSHPFTNAVIYKRDSDVFKYGDGTIPLEPRTIIFATTLAGRGTDIKLSEKLKENGGLHVIIAFLPRNVRIEEQAFGRAARCGEAGTAQLIVFDKNAHSNASILESKWKRDSREAKRIKAITDMYENKIKSEEKCFDGFSAKFKQLTKNINVNKYIRILLKDLLDQWALWLDNSEYVCLDKNSRIEAAEKFCKTLKEIDEQKGPKRPLNILTYAIEKCVDGKYDVAKVFLERLMEIFPAYLPEAKYYTIFLTAKAKDNIVQYKETEKMLIEVKEGLSKIDENISIVEKHRVVSEGSILLNDAFLQHQKIIEQSTEMIIESIENFFGKRIEPSHFFFKGICEEAAFFLHKHFQDNSHYGTNLPIVNIPVKNAFDEKLMEVYCCSNGLSTIETIKNLKKLNVTGITDITMLLNVLEIATWESFWAELKENNAIENVGTHLFVNTSKIPKLSNSYISMFRIKKTSGKIFQHLFVNDVEWDEVDIKKVKACLSIELYQLLTTYQLLVESESATLIADSLSKKNQFKQFCHISENTLILYGIPEEETEEIFENLLNKDILQQHNETIYSLSCNFDIEKCFDLPSWYAHIIIKMIEQKLAFAFSYHNLCMGLPSQLPNQNEKQFITEFTKAGILENTNIDLGSLKKNAISKHTLMKTWDTIYESVDSNNIILALNEVMIFITKIFGTSHAETLNASINVISKSIKDIFNQNCAVKQKFNEFDIELTPLTEGINFEKETFKISNGLSHFISFCGKKWTRKTNIQLLAATAAAVSQVLAGGVMLTCASENGTMPAKFLMTEGASDLAYVVKGVFTGYCESYIKHKTFSLALNVGICGATALGSTRNFQPIYKKGVTALKSMLNKKDIASNAGFNFIKSAYCPFATAIIKRINEKQDIAKFVREATNFAVLQTNTRISSCLRDFFIQSSKISNLTNIVQGMLKTMGINKFDFINISADDIFQRSFDPNIIKICIFIEEQFKSSFVANKDVTKEHSFETRIDLILQSKEFETMISSLIGNLEICIRKLEDIFNDKLLRETGSKGGIDVMIDKPLEKDEQENVILKHTAEQMINSWEQNLCERSEALIEEKVGIPLECINVRNYQNQLNKITLETYSKLRKQQNDIVEAAQEKSNQVKGFRTSEEEMLEDFKINFYENLRDIQESTFDPKIYFAVIDEAVIIDEWGKNFISKVISVKHDKQVFIKTIEDESEETGQKLEKAGIEVKIQQGHETSFIALNHGIFDQIIQQLPDVTEHFANAKDFEMYLIERVNEDTSFYLRKKSVPFNNIMIQLSEN
uniref:Chloroplast protein-transporting ATPase n=1 Tax=Panagrolaimus sp. PS1159 TaxID=55785 RepID=A0AC35G419_9BILA